MIIVIAGVSSCGKTSVGKLLAKKLGYEFIDADDYHSEENKKLMSNGIGLTDENRLPWLLKLHEVLTEMERKNKSCVLACSALKAKYRHLIKHGVNEQDNLNIKFVLIDISFDLASERANSRNHEFVKGASILKSQFECLEKGNYQNEEHTSFAFSSVAEKTKSVEECVDEIIANLNL